MTVRRLYRVAMLAGSAACLWHGGGATAATFSEPSTVFYGKIWGTGSAQPFLMTEGELRWTIRDADGTDLAYVGRLQPLADGQYSYRLDVPHEALTVGLATSGAAVPLSAGAQTHAHLSMTVEGFGAAIVGPAGTTFTADQARRAATYRLDLAVPIEAVDTDGDGIPDWWEDRYGLDKEDPSDADGDPDGDALSNKEEYLAGLDPTQDNRLPTLENRELVAYADGVTALPLRARDTDSAPAELTYTLQTLPAAGTLYLRDVLPGTTASDRALTSGDRFTQADVESGRLVLDLQGAVPPGLLTFGVSLADEDPLHAAYEGVCSVVVYAPGSALAGAPPMPTDSLSLQPWIAGVATADLQRAWSYLLTRDAGYVVADMALWRDPVSLTAPSAGLEAADYTALYGADKPYIMWGGSGDDSLFGGMGNDVLAPGGGDDTCGGGAGSDLFLFTVADGGTKTLTDFSLLESDSLDVSALLWGDAPYVTDYIRIEAMDGVSVVSVDADGDGSGEPDLRIEAPGTALAEADMYRLVAEGTLRVGAKSLAPRLSVTAVIAQASENGPQAGLIVIAREGSLAEALSVNLALSGSALNGVDYEAIASPITLPAGKASVDVPIVPYVDAVTEPGGETVALALLEGEHYVLGTARTAAVTIADLAPLFSVSVLEGTAMESPRQNGVFLVQRTGAVNASVLARLAFGGTARKGIDYTTISPWIEFAAGQTTALVEIAPTGSGFEGYVTLQVLDDAAYLVGMQARASVALVPERVSLADWRAKHYPEATGDLEAFASSRDASGLTYLERYAFGLSADAGKDAPGLPAFFLHEGRLAVTFDSPASVQDVQYHVDVCDDLTEAAWQSGSAAVSALAAEGTDGDPGRAAYAAHERAAAAQFMRVRLVYDP